MIGTDIIAGIVSQLKYDKLDTNTTPNFYQGNYDELNKIVNEENTGFVFLVRPEKFNSEIQISSNINSKYPISIGFFRATNFEDNKITGIDSILDLLETLYHDFLTETYKQLYSIENLSGNISYNNNELDNNVSGILSSMIFVVENEFNICS